MRVLLALLGVWLGVHAASANDSTAEVAAGGLVLTKSDSIEMRSEDLYVSAKLIRVQYRFFNRAAADITTTVAFPMPDLVGEGDLNIALPNQSPNNPLGFATSVGGRAVRTQVERKAFARGVDHTVLLERLNIPLAHYRKETGKALDALPRAKWDELVSLGLAEIEEYDVGKGMEKHLGARWTLKITHYWQQTFPAGREIAIEHRYQPIVGASVMTSVAGPASRQEEWWGEFNGKYCLDDGFLGSADRARQTARSEFGSPFSEERIGYVLKTGANWSGPIRDFRLVVDKGAPSHLVSFCADGVKKISPTQFEIRKRDFTPTQDLNVLILKPLPKTR